jgi:hypothetical protein
MKVLKAFFSQRNMIAKFFPAGGAKCLQPRHWWVPIAIY